MSNLWLNLRIADFYLDLVKSYLWKKFELLKELVVDNLPLEGMDL